MDDVLTSKSSRTWVLALTAAASLMVALDQLVVATALSTIKRDLHGSLATLEWTVNAYSLSFAVLLMTAAVVGDRYGRRRMFVAGLAIFVAASAACALAPSAGWLIAARTVQGAGCALVLPLSLTLLSSAFPVAKRARAIGIYSALTGLAVAGGPLVGGAVTQGLAWQWIFWINVPIGLVVIPLALARLPESTGARARPDLAGIAFVTAGSFGLVWGLVRASRAGWASLEVVSSLVVGAVLLAGFVAWEVRAREPMLPMRYFRNRAFSAGNTVTLLQTASLISAVFFLAQYLQVTLGYSPLQAGLRFLPWTATLFFVAPIAGALVGRVGERVLVVAGMAIQGLGMAWVAYNISNDQPYSASVLALMISGCGTSMVFPAGQNMVMNAVPPAGLGNAAGTYSTVRQMGGVFGVAVLAAIFAANGSYVSGRAFRDGVVPALAVAAAVAIAGSLVGLVAPSGRRRTIDATTPELHSFEMEPARVR
jgi:EmrB/QacA subfamily drug resistance transporter